MLTYEFQANLLDKVNSLLGAKYDGLLVIKVYVHMAEGLVDSVEFFTKGNENSGYGITSQHILNIPSMHFLRDLKQFEGFKIKERNNEGGLVYNHPVSTIKIYLDEKNNHELSKICAEFGKDECKRVVSLFDATSQVTSFK